MKSLNKSTLFTIIIIVAMFGLFKKMSLGNNDPKLANAVKAGALLVDVRTAQEFAGGSVQGAINIPLSDVEKSLGQFRGKGNIVLFCQSGNRSGQAKRILEKHGIGQIFNGGSWRNFKELVDSIK